jgi:ribosome-binding factor A
MKAMSQRQERIAEQVRNEIAMFLLRGDLVNPLLGGGMISVSYLWVSPDLRQCRVYYSPIQGELTAVEIKAITKALNGEAFKVQKVVSKLPMKYTPRIKFFYDDETDRKKSVEDAFTRIGAGHGNIEDRS